MIAAGNPRPPERRRWGRNLAIDAFGNALGGSIADASRPETQGGGPYSSADYRNGSDIESDNYVSPASAHSGGQAWAADVAARRAGARGRQVDELLADVGADGVSVDTRPGSVYVQGGDSLSKIAARFPEYGNANDLKNQLIAANPQLRDPNALAEGMELNFPGAGTVVGSAAMARAVGADGRYQAALAAQQPDAQEPVWSFREASMSQRKLDDAKAFAEYQAGLANGQSMSAWDGIRRDAPGTVSPAYKAVTSGLGMIGDGLGTVQGVAITLTGATLTAAPEPTTLTKWAGVPLTAYGAAFTAKSVAGFGLNATNLITALRGSTVESDYLPGSALEMAVSLNGGSPEAQRLAVAGDMALGLATGRVLDARVATGAVTDPRVTALFPAPTWTTAERQATLLAPNAWNMVTRIEPRAGLLDLTVKSYENIWQPLVPPKKE